MDINNFIFSKTKPIVKLQKINSLSNYDLLSLNRDSIMKIVKQIGDDRGNFKILYLGDRRVSNEWNAIIKSIEICKKKLFVNFYIQYWNTDTDTCDYMENFLRGNGYTGEIKGVDYRCNERTYYFSFNKEHKALLMKNILLEYIYTKYKDQLIDAQFELFPNA